MAKLVEQITLGVDVSKDNLAACHWETEEQCEIVNERGEIGAWLKSFPAPVRLALEPTSHYHLVLIEEAHAVGHEIYLINPHQIAHYRKAVGERNKTDRRDAWLLARFLANEGAQLRPVSPRCQKAQDLWSFLKHRAGVVEARKRLQQSMSGIKLSIRALLAELKRTLERIDQRISSLIEELGWTSDYRRCRSIPGIGKLNAAALVAAYHRGAFANSDAFVAYIGLDVRVRESGHFKGKRKLTKQGEAELRRLLYCAAKPARSHQPFALYHQAQLAKGLSKIAANVILARKLARIAFTLMRNQQTFNPTGARLLTAP